MRRHCQANFSEHFIPLLVVWFLQSVQTTTGFPDATQSLQQLSSTSIQGHHHQARYWSPTERKKTQPLPSRSSQSRSEYRPMKRKWLVEICTQYTKRALNTTQALRKTSQKKAPSWTHTHAHERQTCWTQLSNKCAHYIFRVPNPDFLVHPHVPSPIPYFSPTTKIIFDKKTGTWNQRTSLCPALNTLRPQKFQATNLQIVNKGKIAYFSPCQWNVEEKSTP